MTNALTSLVENAERRAQLTSLQRTCESAARKIMLILKAEGSDTLTDVNELASIIYQEFRERHEL